MRKQLQYTTLFVLVLLALLAGAFHAVKKLPTGYHLTAATVVDATKGVAEIKESGEVGEFGDVGESGERAETEDCNEDKDIQNIENKETSQPCSLIENFE